MFEQITDLVKQFGGDAIVNNPAVPNEHNDAVIEHASGSIIDSIKNVASQEGGLGQLAGALQNGSIDMNNPMVKQILNQVSGSIGSKFGLPEGASSGVASGILPGVLGSILGGGAANTADGNGGGIMDAISKYGGMFGLDKDGDGQVGIGDAVAAATQSSGGIGGLLGKLFGGKS